LAPFDKDIDSKTSGVQNGVAFVRMGANESHFSGIAGYASSMADIFFWLFLLSDSYLMRLDSFRQTGLFRKKFPLVEDLKNP
jgi:hypothetical protein